MEILGTPHRPHSRAAAGRGQLLYQLLTYLPRA